MADNVLLNLPTVPGGQTIATKDVGGGVELSIGALTDITGTTAAAVVPASTPAATTDPALVVAISPNAPVEVTGTITTTPSGTQTVAGTVAVSNFPATQPVSGSVGVTNFPATQPISAASLPLPTGAATDANISARLNTLGQKTSANSAPVVIASDQSAVPVSGSVAVSNFPATQPISAVSLPLPTGAAQDSTLTGGTSKTQVFDGTNVIGTSTHPVRVDPTGSTTQPVSGSVTVSGTSTVTQGTAAALAAAWPVEVTDGTNILGTSAHPVRTDPTGSTTQPVSGAVTVSGTATVTQGTAAALAAAWPVEVTDGTNILGTTTHPVQTNVTDGTHSLPTADAAARALFAKVTDGTNTQPTGDAIARSIAVQVNDGTNVLGTTAHPEIVAGAGVAGTPAGGVVSIQGVASGTAIPVSGAVTVSGTATVTQGTAAALAAAWPVKVTDGTNTQPTGDAIARSIAVQVNDGTNVLGTTAHPEIVAGAGVAGTPAGGVVSIQGVASGTTIPVTAAQSTAANLLANVGGLGTAGSAPTGNPVYVGGKDPSGNLQAMTVGADKSVLVSQTNNQQLVQTNATVTGNGSATYTGNGFKEANLIINCSGTVTGTNPTLTYTIQEVDPQNTGTVIGTSITGVAIIATGTQTIKLADCTTGALKVSWVIGGTATPTFNAVYTTLSFKPTEDVQEQFAPVAEDNVNGIIAVQFLPLAVATYTPTFSPFVAAVSNAVKASPGNLFGFTATCRTASTTVWFQLFNAIAAPSSGNTAIYQWPIVVGLNPAYIEVGRNLFSESGINFTTGIAYGFSTVKNTYTAATAADCDAAFTFK